MILWDFLLTFLVAMAAWSVITGLCKLLLLWFMDNFY